MKRAAKLLRAKRIIMTAMISNEGWNDFPGIEDVLGIERLLDRTHGLDRLAAELALQVFLLALPDAVLAGAGAVHRQRAFDQAMHELLPARHFVGITDVTEQR